MPRFWEVALLPSSVNKLENFYFSISIQLGEHLVRDFVRPWGFFHLEFFHCLIEFLIGEVCIEYVNVVLFCFTLFEYFV